MIEDAAKISKAIAVAVSYGGVDGDHHKVWVIDQMVRALLTEAEYKACVSVACAGEDGPHTYEWNEGIAP